MGGSEEPEYSVSLWLRILRSCSATAFDAQMFTFHKNQCLKKMSRDTKRLCRNITSVKLAENSRNGDERALLFMLNSFGSVQDVF